MVKLTQTQKIIYDTVVWYKECNDGCSPSLQTIRDILIKDGHFNHITGQAIGEHIKRMPELLGRNKLGNLIVIGGKWELVDPQKIEVEER